MKRVIRKWFIRYEKEEEWLNSMAEKGLHMVDYTFCRYLFEEGEPGKYIYRIELLKENPGHPESAAYLKFMEDNGVEVAATYLCWVYFRKKASEGAFEIYTEQADKISHAKRVIGFAGTLLAVDLMSAFYNLALGFAFGPNRPLFNAYFSIVNFAAIAILLPIIIHELRVIARLKQNA